MNNPQKIATTVAVVGVSAIAVKTVHEYHQDVYSRFPEHNRKVLRKAFRRFLWHAYTQQTGDLQNLSDEQMDVLFLQEVERLTNSSK